jgi:integrase
LARRASKGGRAGVGLGERFTKQLTRLGLRREGLSFHSFRHNAAGALDKAGVLPHDAARVLGHRVKGISYGTYSKEGPGLARVKRIVEKITYEGLRLR